MEATINYEDGQYGGSLFLRDLNVSKAEIPVWNNQSFALSTGSVVFKVNVGPVTEARSKTMLAL